MLCFKIHYMYLPGLNDYNILFNSMTVKNLWHASKYLVNLKMSICLDSSSPCEISNLTIFQNTLLPKKKCNLIQTLPDGEYFCFYCLKTFNFIYMIWLYNSILQILEIFRNYLHCSQIFRDLSFLAPLSWKLEEVHTEIISFALW